MKKKKKKKREKKKKKKKKTERGLMALADDVIATLQADGYHVTAPQFPLSSLAADVARLR